GRALPGDHVLAGRRAERAMAGAERRLRRLRGAGGAGARRLGARASDRLRRVVRRPGRRGVRTPLSGTGGRARAGVGDPAVVAPRRAGEVLHAESEPAAAALSARIAAVVSRDRGGARRLGAWDVGVD